MGGVVVERLADEEIVEGFADEQVPAEGAAVEQLVYEGSAGEGNAAGDCSVLQPVLEQFLGQVAGRLEHV